MHIVPCSVFEHRSWNRSCRVSPHYSVYRNLFLVIFVFHRSFSCNKDLNSSLQFFYPTYLPYQRISTRIFGHAFRFPPFCFFQSVFFMFLLAGFLTPPARCDFCLYPMNGLSCNTTCYCSWLDSTPTTIKAAVR
ncbi:unnamed protein product [Amoebophrya sp. A25]|nr:unnamed protein product [Amoebophrya sp. A25]|eukprot:GSA25T00012545001.1